MKLWRKWIVTVLSILLIGYGSYYYYYEIPKDLNSSELKQINFKFRLSDDGKFLNGDLFNNTNRTITEISLKVNHPKFPLSKYDLVGDDYVIPVYVIPHKISHFAVELFDPYNAKFYSVGDIKIIGGKSLPWD